LSQHSDAGIYFYILYQLSDLENYIVLQFHHKSSEAFNDDSRNALLCAANDEERYILVFKLSKISYCGYSLPINNIDTGRAFSFQF